MNRPSTVAVGTIVWLGSEVMFFAGLFAIYFTLRSTSPGLWAFETEKLNVPFALTNTITLVLSSVACQFGVFAAERMQSRWRDDIPQASQAGIYAVATRVQNQPGGLLRLARFVRWALGRMTPEPAHVEARVQGVEALGNDELAGLLLPCALSVAQAQLLQKHCQASGSISSMGSVSMPLRSPPPSART